MATSGTTNKPWDFNTAWDYVKDTVKADNYHSTTIGCAAAGLGVAYLGYKLVRNLTSEKKPAAAQPIVVE